MSLILLGVVAIGIVLAVDRNRRKTARALAEIAQSWRALASMRDRGDHPRGLAERARQYLGATSSIITVVRPGEHLLELREVAEIEPARIRERERDIRRGPFTTRTPIWHDTFLDDGTYTLLVPLISRGKKRGFWMVSFANRDTVTGAQRELIANLARELACAIEMPCSEPTALATIEQGLADHQDIARLCEAMPYGVFVMTVWGHVRYANTAMKLSCALHGIDLDAHDPVALLAALTQHANVHAEVRTLVQTQTPMCLRGERGSVALSWLGGGAEAERLIVGWVMPDASRVESQALLSSLSMTAIAPPLEIGPSGTLRFFAVNQ